MEDHPALVVLKSFFAEMNAWEKGVAARYKAIDWGNTSAEALARDRAIDRQGATAIFEKYCEVGAKATRLQDQGLSFNPDRPEYDPEGEVVVAVTERPGKVIVETKQTYLLKWRMKYEIVETPNGWRIRDNRKRSSDKNPRWDRDML